MVTHRLGNVSGHLASLRLVITQPQHDQGITQSCEADADAALGARLAGLLWQGPCSDVQHVVQRTHLPTHGLCKGPRVKCCRPPLTESVANKPRQDEWPEHATPIRRQRLLTARVGGLYGFDGTQVVVPVNGVQKKQTRLSAVVRRMANGCPQGSGWHSFVDPQSITSDIRARGQAGGWACPGPEFAR